MTRQAVADAFLPSSADQTNPQRGLNRMVRAAVLTGIRQMQIQQFPVPEIHDDDALLRVDMVGVCGSDPGYYNGKMVLDLPLILGHEIVGTIERIGPKMAELRGVQGGDRVVVETRFGCGLCAPCIMGNYKACIYGYGYGRDITCDREPFLWGAYGEYLYIPPRGLIHKIDKDVPLEAAVLTCAVVGNAIRWLRTLGNQSIGDTVVILGAGQAGLAGIVAAREAGASKIIVTGTKRSVRRLEMAKTLGADHVTTNEGAIEFVREVTNGKLADVVMDASGDVHAFEQSIHMVRKQGMVVTPGLYGDKRASLDVDRIVLDELTIRGAHTHDFPSTEAAIRLIEGRKHPIEKIVTHVFSLDEAERAVLVAGREVPGEDPIKVVIDPWK